MKNKNRGITLISLVITIIIMLILAGVSLNLITGETLKLVVEENKIAVGDQVYKLAEKTKIVNPTLSIEYIEQNEEYSGNNILVLKIPIINELYPNIDFGVNLVYLYNIN